MLVEKKVEVPKEYQELLDSIVMLVKSVKEAGKDGFQAATDIPNVVLANLDSLAKGVSGANKVDDELKAHLDAFVMASAVAGAEVAGVFLKKED